MLHDSNTISPVHDVVSTYVGISTKMKYRSLYAIMKEDCFHDSFDVECGTMTESLPSRSRRERDALSWTRPCLSRKTNAIVHRVSSHRRYGDEASSRGASRIFQNFEVPSTRLLSSRKN